MLRWPMYVEIHQLKELGLRKTQVAKRLGINVKTVSKYWDVSPEGMVEIRNRAKQTKYSAYEETILSWLWKYPDVSSSQIQDWLREHFPEYKGQARSIRNWVAKLRKKHGISKSMTPRQYQAVDDPPMGFQAQVDFGEKKVKKVNGETIKIYGFAMVLSHSRFKYVEWTDRPLTTAKAIEMHQRAFEYFGGIPRELVYDQDRVLFVSENGGDILCTAPFETYRQAMGFQIRLCRAYDPESKGRIEAVIKYAKNHFAQHRVYHSLDQFNQECLEWLERTANANIHGTTEKVPAQVFSYEKDHLQPIPHLFGLNPRDILTRAVRKDNTVKYLSNRYSVPLGTYKPGKEVQLQPHSDHLQIIDLETGEIIAEHVISLKRGHLVSNTNHLRNQEQKIQEWKQQLLEQMPEKLKFEIFLNEIHQRKPRYIRDHCQIIASVVQKYSAAIVIEALAYCSEYELWSAFDLRDAAAHFHIRDQEQTQTKRTIGVSSVKQENPQLYQMKTEVRSIQDYLKLWGEQ